VLRRPAGELFQPQGTRVSSHLSFNCFVTLKVAPRTSAQAGSTGAGRGKARGVMAGSVMRDRVMVVERHLVGAANGGGRSLALAMPSFASRPFRAGVRSGDSSAERRQTGGRTQFNGAGDAGAIGSNSAMRTAGSDAAGMRADGRVFAVPRGLLQTAEAAQAFGHMVRRLRRQESRMTPMAAVAVRRASAAPGSGEGERSLSRDTTFTAHGIGMELPTTAMRAQAADVNIEALASKVMQQIDRRLVAHRERMGRI